MIPRRKTTALFLLLLRWLPGLPLGMATGASSLLLLLSVLLMPARATELEPPLDATLNEHVIYVPVGTWPQERLQVTVFTPEGHGPFPLAVLNHGKEAGRPQDAKRYRSAYAARYFLSRGYAVVLPMLRGFAGSSGLPLLEGCDAQNEGLKQAADLQQVIRYMATQSDVAVSIDTSRVVVFGQSLGGWYSLALGALDVPGVRGLVSFAGGRSAPFCPRWQQQLAVVAGYYGQQTHVPSIWFYGDNDAVFAQSVWRPMYDSYNGPGHEVELVAYGNFQKDAHNFLGHIEALPIWTPRVDAFLKRIGLPGTSLYPKYLPPAYPVPTGFATVDDAAAVPLIPESERANYRSFLLREMPRVFVIATSGAVITTDGGFDPLARAMALCAQHMLRCQPYAVDDQVVWPKPTPLPLPSRFAETTNEAAVPYLSDAGRQGYVRFLTLPRPRAFAIAPDGTWSFSSRDFDVQRTALQNCSARHQGCQIYAVDDQVVWVRPASTATSR